MKFSGAFCSLVLVGIAGVAPSYAENGDEIWRFDSAGEIYGSPAMDEAGNLYFGSRDGKVYSLDSDGGLRWSFETGDWVDSSPSLSPDGSVVYFGSWDNFMYAVSSQDGSLAWSYETGSLIAASPAVDSLGNLYFGSSDGFFYSLSGSGVLRWLYFVGEEMDSSPAVALDGSVYVGAYDGLLYAFSPGGELKWTFATEETVDPADRRIKSPPTIDGEGNVYFGGGDGNVYCLNQDGQELWRFETEEKVDTGIALAGDGSAIFGSRDGFLYSVDAFGVYNWESYVGDVFYSTPALDEFDNVYVGAYLGNGVSGITAVSSSGNILWESLVLGYIDSSPLVGDSAALYFGSYDGSFYAIETNALQGDSAWSRFGGDRGNRSEQSGEAVALSPSPEYSEWLQSNGLYGDESMPDNDSDGDGLGLLMEYWLGGDPSREDGSLVDLRADPGESDWVSLEFVRASSESVLELDIEVSEDFVSWNPIGVALDPSNYLEELVDQDVFGDGKYELVRLRFEGSMRRFVRLKSSLQ